MTDGEPQESEATHFLILAAERAGTLGDADARTGRCESATEINFFFRCFEVVFFFPRSDHIRGKFS